MPKVTRVGKFRAVAKAAAAVSAASSVPETDDASSSDVKAPLSRGQRKRLAKREQYLKRERMVMSSLKLQRLEEQKGKLDGLDAIRDSLPEFHTECDANTEPKTKSFTTCSSNKSKKSLAHTEISHMGLVLDHPAFQENPFSAITQHLRNSLASDAEKMNEESLNQTEEDRREMLRRREERKERLRGAKFSKSQGRKKKNSSTLRPRR
ncbi:hypothetical protein HJC23_006711 [Cyclotella cryptica]|uniref:Ribosome biogenesis protein NOP53 n=1 Tax=Cyclotella cryptica TaxID=29204 RepID=A0ABD3NZ01_9STRA|eukprot:CCRYP_018854-RA/>CCRYP_018854-RA protein AED:0.37 eAED:0.37 QI:144/1/1/1/0/0/2/409/207